VAEIGAIRYPGSTELPLKICDSQPSRPPLAIPGVGHSGYSFLNGLVFEISLAQL
jgi:hypothetical protein